MRYAVLTLAVLIVPLCATESASCQTAPESPVTSADQTIRPVDLGIDPKLPNVLSIGDSISIHYTPHVVADLSGKANVFHSGGRWGCNAGSTGISVRMEKQSGRRPIESWLVFRGNVHFSRDLYSLVKPKITPEWRRHGDPDEVHFSRELGNPFLGKQVAEAVLATLNTRSSRYLDSFLIAGGTTQFAIPLDRTIVQGGVTVSGSGIVLALSDESVVSAGLSSRVGAVILILGLRFARVGRCAPSRFGSSFPARRRTVRDRGPTSR